MEQWGPGSFENDPAIEWFHLLEEAIDPGAMIAGAMDDALSEPDEIDLDLACAAIAAAELSASAAGHTPERLPDGVRRWVETHPHQPHGAEVERAVEALDRVRAQSALRERWDETGESGRDEWLECVDDLIARLGRSDSGDPASLSP
ncbi:MAG TPA: DUF4259 domain-containing protein [Solirubrobacteraceae bacterium]|nr:DUF4259 domain-containing protein [Solirubrobacteraceae bacterium]